MTKQRNPLEQIEFMRNVLAFGLVSSFVGAMIAFTFYLIPEGNKDILTYMVGQLSGMATMALGFYFVSKVGQDALDAQKSDNTKEAFSTMRELIDKNKNPGTYIEEAADQVADAAVDEAAKVKKKRK